ncbi:hypothetical protein C922_02926 [Plasmodium inui San Antonio 1]|uniref:Uncharacterized protein n=1 Tax=Plasmodium inui San Antonio 1 TaxID=1237626 RepID=W7A4H6_9APIC|nr:hypothetical protein C922_02926 [Plasmodium inui San Antonio 1]EUD66605.1 hypothetical protein C922_02926 [Plasmodium inui San Antonio 1]
MVEDEGGSGFRRVSTVTRVNAARPGRNSEDDEERRTLPPSRDDTIHLEEDETGESPPLATSKGISQLSIQEIKVGKLNLRSFRRKREEEKKKKKQDGGGENDKYGEDADELDYIDDLDDERRGDPPSGTPSSDKEDVLTKSSSTCTELLNGRLLLSGYEFAADGEKLREKKITHIVNMGGEECPNRFEATISYRTYYVKDDLREDMFYTLLDAAHFIEEMLTSEKGNKILVHCNKGVSRSVIVVIFFLMTHLELPFGDAFDLVKKLRPLSNPNLSFVSQLLCLFRLRRRLRISAVEETALVGSNGVATLAGRNRVAALAEPPQGVDPPGEVTLIFRIDAAGKALTLTNLMSLSPDENACTSCDSAGTKVIEIDRRFNYVVTTNFRAFYLLLLDSTFEDVCTPFFERFARICRTFFHCCPSDSADSTDLTQTIVRSDVGELMQGLRLETLLVNALPCNDVAYRKVQEVSQQVLQRGEH